MLRQKSLNSYLGPEFRQLLKETKYEVPLKSFGEKKLFCPESVTKLGDLTVIFNFERFFEGVRPLSLTHKLI